MRRSVAIGIWILLGVAIFSVDLFLPFGVATGVLYVVLAFLASWGQAPFLPFVAAGLISVLVAVGWYLSPAIGPNDIQFGAINRFLSLLAIWVTAALAALLIRSRQAEKRITNALRSSEAKFRAAIAHSPITVAGCDAERRYTWIYNQDASFDAVGVIGKRDEELLPPEHAAELVELKCAALKQGEIIRREIWVTVAGMPRCYDMTAEPIGDAESGDVGLVTAAFETTALRNAEAQLRAANRQKDDFLAALSHELRNPMAAIQSSLELITATDERTRRGLAVLRRQSVIMTRLVDDLLSVTRLKHGKFALRCKVIDVCQSAREAAEAMREQIEEIGLQLVLDLPPEPIHVHGDPERLAQIFDNLLRNASRHTKAGRITVTACKDGEYARIAVRDTGIGIDLRDHAAVFEPYFQSSPANHFGSLGLGLTLVKGIVEKHGGTVSLHSEGHGRGSEFTFTIPLAALAPEIASTAATLKLRPRRILVVDDYPDSADMFAAILKCFGQRVEVAYGGNSALAVAREHRPEVAFLDLSMPDMDGRELARRLREQFPSNELTLIALSGCAPKHHTCKLDSEFAHYLLKPANADTVVELLKSL